MDMVYDLFYISFTIPNAQPFGVSFFTLSVMKRMTQSILKSYIAFLFERTQGKVSAVKTLKKEVFLPYTLVQAETFF